MTSEPLLLPDATAPSGQKLSRNVRVPLPSALRTFCLAYGLALGGSLMVMVAAHKAGLPETRWNPLSDPFMGDLMEYPGVFQLIHSAAFFDNRPPGSLPVAMFSAVAYPPFAAVLLAPLYRLAHPTWLFLFAALCWLSAVSGLVTRALLRAGLAPIPAALLPSALLLSSFPVQRLIHQGNIELLVWAFVATGTYAFMRERHVLAAGLWGMAAAAKLYPLLLLFLLIPKKRHREVLFGCTAFLAVTFLSVLWIGPTPACALRGSLRNVFGYQTLRASEWSLRELTANHSGFLLIKLCAQMVHIFSSHLTLQYYVGGAAIFLWSFFGRLAKLSVTNQLVAVTVCMVLLPTVSYYHTLVHLYAPLLILVFVAIESQRAGITVPGLRTTLLLFIPLSMPYTLFTFPRMFVFCGLIQSAALGVLFLCALQYPFPQPTGKPAL